MGRALWSSRRPQGAPRSNLVKYKVWPITRRRLCTHHRRHGARPSCFGQKQHKHERHLASKAERDARKASTSSTTAEDVPVVRLKKCKHTCEDCNAESADSAGSVEGLDDFLDESTPWEWIILENRVPCTAWQDLPVMAQTSQQPLSCFTASPQCRSWAVLVLLSRDCSMQQRCRMTISLFFLSLPKIRHSSSPPFPPLLFSHSRSEDKKLASLSPSNAVRALCYILQHRGAALFVIYRACWFFDSCCLAHRKACMEQFQKHVDQRTPGCRLLRTSGTDQLLP